MQESKRPSLRVIEGGKAEPQRAIVTNPPKTKNTSAPSLEERKLVAAVLRLHVEETGMTVEQMLDELDDKCDSLDEADCGRCAYLDYWLCQIGLRYSVAEVTLGLSKVGFAVLTWPIRLQLNYPHLKELRPEGHPYIMIR